MPPPKKKNRQRNQLLITLGVMALLGIGLGLWLTLGTTEAPALGEAPPPAAPKQDPPPKQDKPVEKPAGEDASLIDNDGRTLWVSPTDGNPISLGYLPPGSDFVLHLRPWSLLESTSDAVAALGPQGAALVARFQQTTGYALEEVDELLVGVRGAGQRQIEVALVVRPREPLSQEGDAPSLPAPFRLARKATHEEVSYRVGSPLCCLVPAGEAGKLFVVASRPAMHEIIEAGGAAPPLRRELEVVAATTDRNRHATLLVAPSFLFTEGRPLFSGVTESLREPAFEFHPDALRAAAFSAHWGEDFYLEARGAAAAELSATRLAALLDRQVSDWPSKLQLAVLDLNPAPHSRRLVAQLPAMARLLAEYTRYGAEQDVALLNCYLPKPAGNNLLAASELMLAQLSAGAGGAAPTTPIAGPQNATIAEKLRQKVSVSFARDTLEMAVQYLSDEIQTPVVILGGDLQLEGITKNQSFGMDASGLPAEEVLLEILQKANPDKTAAGPTDPKQKLVYVVKPGDNGREAIYVTTRAAAAKRGEELPSVFSEQ